MDLRDAVALSILPAFPRRYLAEARCQTAPGGPLASVPLASVVRRVTEGRARAMQPVAAALERADRLLDQAARRRIDPIHWHDSRYSAPLAAIVDPPPILWTRGKAEALATVAVAVVGSRAASRYALEVAGWLGNDLARRGVTVVSGLARGVDSAAHRGAVASGVTLAVLGSGADVIYPAEHDALALSILERGAIVSELPPGTPPRPAHFPLRNRIISGLSRAVVIVEASDRSGSLITARCGLDQGRDVMAVPGSVLGRRKPGFSRFIKGWGKGCRACGRYPGGDRLRPSGRL